MSRESLLKHITTDVCTFLVEVDYWTDYVICTGSQFSAWEPQTDRISIDCNSMYILLLIPFNHSSQTVLHI